MNYPAANCVVSAERDENFRKGVTPECFYRGSTVLTTTLSHVEWVAGPGPIRLDSRLRGNDGLRKGTEFNAASCGGIRPVGIKKFSELCTTIRDNLRGMRKFSGPVVLSSRGQ